MPGWVAPRPLRRSGCGGVLGTAFKRSRPMDHGGVSRRRELPDARFDDKAQLY
ncbi:hypothetical protein ACFZCP_07210 [Streptomyces sp. NPDC007971]|uniref:hypothetical protein n=1 Tax=Streptomyces sp. NPDC007971 TaxID=3364799 RepID=UPI0036E89F6C